MCKKLISGGVLGGLILFVWSGFSWMFLPWHSTTIFSFKDEVIIKNAITTSVSKPGVYFLPGEKAQANNKLQAPVIFATVQLENPASMNYMMGVSLLIQFISAFLVTWLVSKAVNLSYLKRVGFIIIFALTTGIIAFLPYWNWFGFPTYYTLVMLADLLMGWFLAGLVIAKISLPSKA